MGGASRFGWLVAGAGILLPSVVLAAGGAGGGMDGGDITHRMTALVLQLAVILCAAKLGGVLFERFLRLPDVLGELVAGMVVGPYGLGPLLGLFAPPEPGVFPISPELYGIATLASIVLLYMAGLETDLSMFLRYSVVGSCVGVGGVVVSFLVGDAAAVWFGLADGYGSPAALFLGTISTATSVGISARVLSRKNKIDSPEGVTVLSGAVVDDVLGIVVLAVVVGVSRVKLGGGSIAWGGIALVASKALGFWLFCSVVGMLSARRISKGLERLGSPQTMAAVSLGLALLLAGLAEKASLAMIIGAYIMGLSLSRVDAAHALRQHLVPVYNTFVGIFFAVMGMMVDLRAMKGVIVVGVLYSLAAMVAKVAGCGGPALLLRFNLRGALRVGVGMLPRGEVTLLVAGVGLSGGFIPAEIFGVAVMMTLLSTLVAPLIMMRIYDDRNGLSREGGDAGGGKTGLVSLELPNPDVADFLLGQVLRMFEAEECYVHQVTPRAPIHQVRKDEMTLTVQRQGNCVQLSCSAEDKEFARLIFLEALASVIKTFEGLREMDGEGTLRQRIVY